VKVVTASFALEGEEEEKNQPDEVGLEEGNPWAEKEGGRVLASHKE